MLVYTATIVRSVQWNMCRTSFLLKGLWGYSAWLVWFSFLVFTHTHTHPALSNPMVTRYSSQANTYSKWMCIFFVNTCLTDHDSILDHMHMIIYMPLSVPVIWWWGKLVVCKNNHAGRCTVRLWVCMHRGAQVGLSVLVIVEVEWSTHIFAFSWPANGKSHVGSVCQWFPQPLLRVC